MFLLYLLKKINNFFIFLVFGHGIFSTFKKFGRRKKACPFRKKFFILKVFNIKKNR